MFGQSERILNTLEIDGFDQYLILSEWKNIPSEFEFRCFVYKNKLRAITQYGKEFETNVLFSSKKDYLKILEKIKTFYNSIKNHIPYDDCIMDVLVWDEKQKSNNMGVFLIEFNCFGAETPAGSGLFNWIQDHHVLYQSDKPVLRFAFCDEFENIEHCDVD